MPHTTTYFSVSKPLIQLSVSSKSLLDHTCCGNWIRNYSTQRQSEKPTQKSHHRAVSPGRLLDKISILGRYPNDITISWPVKIPGTLNLLVRTIRPSLSQRRSDKKMPKYFFPSDGFMKVITAQR